MRELFIKQYLYFSTLESQSWSSVSHYLAVAVSIACLDVSTQLQKKREERREKREEKPLVVLSLPSVPLLSSLATPLTSHIPE